MFDLHIITDALHIPKKKKKCSIRDQEVTGGKITVTGFLPVLTTSKLQNKIKLDKRQDIMDLLRKKNVTMCDPSSCCLCPTHTHSEAIHRSQQNRGYKWKLFNNIPFLYFISVKILYPHISLLGNPRRKPLACLHMESNCPKTGPDPNKRGAKLSQMGLDTKRETRAIWIRTKSPCNDQ